MTNQRTQQGGDRELGITPLFVASYTIFLAVTSLTFINQNEEAYLVVRAVKEGRRTGSKEYRSSRDGKVRLKSLGRWCVRISWGDERRRTGREEPGVVVEREEVMMDISSSDGNDSRLPLLDNKSKQVKCRISC